MNAQKLNDISHNLLHMHSCDDEKTTFIPFLHINVYNGGPYNACKYFCPIYCLHFVLNKNLLLCHFFLVVRKKGNNRNVQST